MCGGAPVAPATLALTQGGNALPPTPPTTMPFEITIDGVVEASPARTLTVNPCAPGTMCGGPTATLTVSATSLPATLAPVGAFVSLHFKASTTVGMDLGLQTELVVDNLPTFMNSTNPVSSTARVWFAAMSETSEANAPASFVPFQAVTVACGSRTDCTSSAEQWSFTGAGVATTTVQSGAPFKFQGTGALAGSYTFFPLQASSDCEGNGGSSYWLAGT